MTHSIVSSRWILLFSVYLVVHIPTIVFTRTVNGDASHPEIRIQDPFYGGLTFRRGEDVFGRFSRSEKELSPKEIRDREIKTQKDRKEMLWSQFQKTLPKSERWSPENTREMFGGRRRETEETEEMLGSAAAGPILDWTRSIYADNPMDGTPNVMTTSLGPKLTFRTSSQDVPERASPWAGERTRDPRFANDALRTGRPVLNAHAKSAYEAVRKGMRGHDPRNKRLISTPSWWERPRIRRNEARAGAPGTGGGFA